MEVRNGAPSLLHCLALGIVLVLAGGCEPQPPAPAIDVTGTWVGTVDSTDGPPGFNPVFGSYALSLDLVQAGSSVTGTFRSVGAFDGTIVGTVTDDRAVLTVIVSPCGGPGSPPGGRAAGRNGAGFRDGHRPHGHRLPGDALRRGRLRNRLASAPLKGGTHFFWWHSPHFSKIRPEQLLAKRVMGVVAPDAVSRSVNVAPRVLVAGEAHVVARLEERSAPFLRVAAQAVTGHVGRVRGDGLRAPGRACRCRAPAGRRERSRAGVPPPQPSRRGLTGPHPVLRA